MQGPPRADHFTNQKNEPKRPGNLRDVFQPVNELLGFVSRSRSPLTTEACGVVEETEAGRMRDWAELSCTGAQWGRREEAPARGKVQQLDPSKCTGQGLCKAANLLGDGVWASLLTPSPFSSFQAHPAALDIHSKCPG